MGLQFIGKGGGKPYCELTSFVSSRENNIRQAAAAAVVVVVVQQ